MTGLTSCGHGPAHDTRTDCRYHRSRPLSHPMHPAIVRRPHRDGLLHMGSHVTKPRVTSMCKHQMCSTCNGQVQCIGPWKFPSISQVLTESVTMHASPGCSCSRHTRSYSPPLLCVDRQTSTTLPELAFAGCLHQLNAPVNAAALSHPLSLHQHITKAVSGDEGEANQCPLSLSRHPLCLVFSPSTAGVG